VRLCAIHFRRHPRRRRNAGVAIRGSRVAVALLLVYQAVFLNVFVPSHTPAIVTIDGSTPVASAGHHESGAHHCCAPAADVDRNKEGGDRRSDDSSNRSRCAVCILVARLTPPVAVDMKLPEHGLLELLPVLPPHVAESAATFPTYLGRGPPAGAPVIAALV